MTKPLKMQGKKCADALIKNQLVVSLPASAIAQGRAARPSLTHPPHFHQRHRAREVDPRGPRSARSLLGGGLRPAHIFGKRGQK